MMAATERQNQPISLYKNTHLRIHMLKILSMQNTFPMKKGSHSKDATRELATGNGGDR
jgi:hypothetical protein